jgi:hypothetical protein
MAFVHLTWRNYMSWKYLVALGLICAVAAALAPPVAADVNLGGYARSIGMGGAGLAVLDDPMATSLINPAAIALHPKRLSFAAPSLDIREEGASSREVFKSLDDLSNSNTEAAIELARDFGGHDTTIGLDLSTSLSMSTYSLGFGGEGIASIVPNDVFKAWALNGTIPDTPSDAQATVTADAAVYMPSVSFGTRVPRVKSGELYLGARGKVVRGTHYEQTLQLEVNPDTLTADIVEDGAEIRNEGTGFGMDTGLIYKTPGSKQTSFGLVVTNLLKPSIPVVQQSIVSLGMATKPVSNVLIAADLVNLTRSYNQGVKLRFGAEVQFTKRLALRAGYSGDAFTYGIGLFGYNFAFSSETPLTIAQTIRF